jgi:polysaccharide chain length determinant protein (PEP-CTERM system associated)
MEQWYIMVRQVLAAAWHRRWLLLASAWIVCIAGWAGVYMVPDSFESSGRLYVDADAILTPLLQGLAIDTATANQLDMMQKTLLSRPNLEKLISATDLNLSVTSPQQREQLVLQLGKELKITSEGKNLFVVAYRNQNPRLAFQSVSGLLNIFMDKATGSNRSDMENAQKFLNQQIASYETQLRAAEQRRAEFRRKYLDILPLESNGGVSRLDSARVSVRNLEADLQDALAKRTALQEEARVTPPVLSVGTAIGQVLGTTSAQDPLTAAEAKLAELRARFTDHHPDVIITRQLIASLKANPPAAPKRAETSAPTQIGPGRSALTNPVYEQLRLRLVETESTISALQGRLDTAKHDLSRMEDLARAAPQVEAEHEDLDRGYNVLRKNYEELLARRESSNITAAADTGADKVRLRVIDPPQIPTLPVAPNRLLLMSLVLLAGLGAPVGLAILLSQTDRSIADLGRLRELGHPVLGAVSMVQRPFGRPMLYAQSLGISASLLLLLIVYGGLTTQVMDKHRVILSWISAHI